jgi:uncharacterized protein (DUF1697 family)
LPATHIALIRGINVGKANRVSMADLRTLVEGIGYGDVRTLLNSGNVIFTSRAAPKLAATRIEKALEAKTGVSARVTVLTAAELAAAVADNPLVKVEDPTRLLVAVLNSADDRRHLETLTNEDWGTERLAVGLRVAYLWCPDGILASRLAVAVGKALGNAVTSRNWATILKLHAAIENSVT